MLHVFTWQWNLCFRQTRRCSTCSHDSDISVSDKPGDVPSVHMMWSLYLRHSWVPWVHTTVMSLFQTNQEMFQVCLAQCSLEQQKALSEGLSKWTPRGRKETFLQVNGQEGILWLGLPALHNRNELMQNMSGLCLSSIPHLLDARFLVLCLLTELFHCCQPRLKFQDLRGGKSPFDSLLPLLVAHRDGRWRGSNCEEYWSCGMDSAWRFSWGFLIFILSVNSESELMLISARLHSLLSVTPSFCFVFSPPVSLSRLFRLLVVHTHKETREYDVYRYVYNIFLN